MQDASPSLRHRFSLMRDHHSSAGASAVVSTGSMSSHRQVYKLNIPDRYSSADDFSMSGKTASTSSASASSSSLSSMTSSLSFSFRSLRMPRRRPKSQKRRSIGTTGTSVVTICNEEEDDDEELMHQQLRGHDDDDDEDDIAILQPEEDGPSSPEKRARRWRRNFSSMRMAISRSSSFISSSSSASSKKRATTMYSISFYPWKRDPRAYYSHPEAAAEWVPDTASKRCQICLASFNLTRRRHHCRLCGLLACNDCSLQRTYFPFSLECRSHHHLIKDGAPQRTCNACAGTLKNMAAQSDPRVKKFTAYPPASDPFGMRDDGDDNDDSRYFDSRRSSQWRVNIGDEDIYVIDGRNGTSRRRHLVLASCGASRAQTDELDEVLRARTLSRRNPKPKYYVVSAEWLEMWLQYVQVDAPPASHSGSSSHHSKRRDTTTQSQSSRAHSKRPGPIANYSLLNFVSGKLLPKDNLERSRGNDAGGDYRIVSEEVWTVFLGLYGGGPCIELRLDDDKQRSPNKSNVQNQIQHTLVRKNSALDDGSCSGSTNPSRWKIIEIDDTIAPLISKEPLDLLKGIKKMRRAASTSQIDSSSIGSSGRSTKQRSSVYPIRETAPCITSDVERFVGRQQPYYPRDSIVNCITSPPYSVTEENKKTNAHRHHKHQQSKKPLRDDSISSNGSFLSSNASCDVSDKVSVGTVLHDPVDNFTSQKRRAHVHHAADDRHHSARVESPHGNAVSAVSAFALAAAEARKKSARSLSRHSSALSSSMIKSQSRVSAASAPASA